MGNRGLICSAQLLVGLQGNLDMIGPYRDFLVIQQLRTKSWSLIFDFSIFIYRLQFLNCCCTNHDMPCHVDADLVSNSDKTWF